MFKDKVQVKDFEKMDPEYQDLLRRLLTIQSDCEIDYKKSTGNIYLPWSLGRPEREKGISPIFRVGIEFNDAKAIGELLCSLITFGRKYNLFLAT